MASCCGVYEADPLVKGSSQRSSQRSSFAAHLSGQERWGVRAQIEP